MAVARAASTPSRASRWRGTAIPLVPAASLLLPSLAPVLTPARWRIRPPAAKIPRRIAVVAYRDAQDEQRHHRRRYARPRPAVPGAGVPVIVLIDPVHAIVEEEIRIQSWSIVNGVTRYPDKVRVERQVDPDAYAGKPDADAHLSHGRSHRPNHHPQHSQSMAHFFSDASSRLRACCQRTVTPTPSFTELLSGQTSRLSARCSVRQRTLRRPGPDQAMVISSIVHSVVCDTSSQFSDCWSH
jgi:hypothetical protein